MAGLDVLSTDVSAKNEKWQKSFLSEVRILISNFGIITNKIDATSYSKQYYVLPTSRATLSLLHTATLQLCKVVCSLPSQTWCYYGTASFGVTVQVYGYKP